jgi:hypothetical protein
MKFLINLWYYFFTRTTFIILDNTYYTEKTYIKYDNQIYYIIKLTYNTHFQQVLTVCKYKE